MEFIIYFNSYFFFNNITKSICSNNINTGTLLGQKQMFILVMMGFISYHFVFYIPSSMHVENYCKIYARKRFEGEKTKTEIFTFLLLGGPRQTLNKSTSMRRLCSVCRLITTHIFTSNLRPDQTKESVP